MGEPHLQRSITYLGDFTWNSVSGRRVGLKPVPLQSLSELERVRLQDVAFRRLLQDRDLGCHITIPKYGHKHKKSLMRKLDSLSKEKSKDKETTPQAFGIPLSQVISNDHTHKQRHDPPREEHSDPTELMLSFLHLNSNFKRANKEQLSSSNSSLSSTSETPNESPLLSIPIVAPRTRRRGGVSVDCITDLDDNQSCLLEALQLSLPAEAAGNRKKRHDKKLSLNPIYRQVPRVVDVCCQHLEKYGLQTVGIFRVGSSKKRVRQLREEFDQGWEVHLDEEHSVHDVAALLKEFLRDMPDPLLTRELYTAFINTMLLDYSDQECAIQLLMFLLPPCNCDTLQRLLCLLSTVAAHAEDILDKEGHEMTGNKMTSLNLATIFGPNLLHKQKNSDKEFAVESFARAEESAAIISVVQRMINTYDTLFMVPADLQNEVLMSLLDTDPDVVDYLLRRKASQYSDSGILRPDKPFSLTDRHLSNDSIKASSGEVSPYDNNSPVLSDRLLSTADSSPRSDGITGLSGQYKFSGHSKEGSGNTSPVLSTYKEGSTDNLWDAWHELFNKDFTGHRITGSLGDMSECESYGSSEGLSSHQGNNKLLIRPTQTSLGGLEYMPHLPVTRSSSGPHDQRGQRQPESSLHQGLSGQSGALSSDNLAERTGHPVGPFHKVRRDSLSSLHYSGPLRETHISHSTPSIFSYQHNPQTTQQSQQSNTPKIEDTADASGQEKGSSTPNLQTERWHIWPILSKDNTDALPETLV
ncbi:rho GTPase-activating protein 6-like isoform X2 [Thunnus albacares]|uniref:rho GTPase-activating protein 6-like isoform X2 n=1 Tax=Thunnus maccoyii TaxID=8240 RepID=UPI001C4D8EEC|nr:rho GTPase-activating protein 6-like isoform X2 [Thunnus maccoyii]XP_044221996.1 rho GTPase-activating protein 6-like isoform X2 [Thunnus albacares]